jgi:hypothetical protein
MRAMSQLIMSVLRLKGDDTKTQDTVLSVLRHAKFRETVLTVEKRERERDREREREKERVHFP